MSLLNSISVLLNMKLEGKLQEKSVQYVSIFIFVKSDAESELPST
jgi:hypothetical protein